MPLVRAETRVKSNGFQQFQYTMDFSIGQQCLPARGNVADAPANIRYICRNLPFKAGASDKYNNRFDYSPSQTQYLG